jgi:uncharacterized protein YciI
MRFDQYTVTLLVLRSDAPALSDDEANALQDRHLHHNATLYEAGSIVAVGPLADPQLRGLSIWAVDADKARELAEQDPGVVEGRFEVQVMTWRVPAGIVSFPTGRVPHSIAEVRAPD